MSHQPPVQRQVEFVAYVRTRGPLTLNQATDYVRLNNMTEPDPCTLCLSWLKAALETREIQLYRNADAGILYGMPKLKSLKRYLPLPPTQTNFTRPTPATITEAARAAAQAAATLK